MPEKHKEVSIKEAVRDLTKLIRVVEERDEVITITRHRAPAAVLLSPEAFSKLTRRLAYLETVVLAARFQGRGLRASELVGEARQDLEGRV